jgi:hypothetical protein
MSTDTSMLDSRGMLVFWASLKVALAVAAVVFIWCIFIAWFAEHARTIPASSWLDNSDSQEIQKGMEEAKNE